MGIASLVLGIVSIIFWFVPFMGWFGVLLGIVGIILGAQGRKNDETRGIATGGLVCSVIGTVLNLLIFIACTACVGAAGLL